MSEFWRGLRHAIKPPPTPPHAPGSIADLPRPDSFVRMSLCDAIGDAVRETLPYEPPPAEGMVEADVEMTEGGVRVISHHIAISETLAIEYGLIEPPEGWEPPVIPVPPLRRRLRYFLSGQVYRLRIALANRLAGFDVEDRY